jgi:hypothetical protein
LLKREIAWPRQWNLCSEGCEKPGLSIMTIDCEQCMKLISRQLDRAASDKETQAVRTHAVQCEKCRVRFNQVTGADRLLSRALQAQALSDGFSSMVAQKLAEAHLAESAREAPKVMMWAALGLACLLVVMLILLAARSGPEIPSIGDVGRVEGTFELARFGSDSFHGADIGEDIPQGASVRTQQGAGVLKLSDGRQIALRQSTLLDLEHYHDGGIFLLEKGEVYVIADETDAQVDTPSAKIYGSGASFLVSCESSGKTTVVVKSGEASLFNALGAVRILEGERAEVMEDEKPRKPEKANIDVQTGWVRQLGL